MGRCAGSGGDLVGAILLEVVESVVGPMGTGHVASDLFEVALFLAVGLIISIVASQTEGARRRAEIGHGQAVARERGLRRTTARMDEFLSVASHELKTPLTTLLMATQEARRKVRLALEADTASDAARAVSMLQEHIRRIDRLLEQIERQARNQTRLLGDLADVSRVRNERLELHMELCELAPPVQHAIQDQQVIWPTRVISLSAPEGSAWVVKADAERIGQVVSNYLTNALKYSEGNTPVAVEMRREGRFVRVSVRDEGPGLPASEHRRIWARYYKAPGVVDQSGVGVGLGIGLHICKAIIERHNGRVGLESAPGQGSTFWFTLPLESEAE